MNAIPRPEAHPVQALIEARELSRVYRMGEVDVRALDGVTLRVDPGEFIAITGPSGSGKSTLLSILGCLDRASAGTYIFAGRDVEELSDAEFADARNRRIGFVFQSFNLLARSSALENVALPLRYRAETPPPDERRARALAALERVGLRGRGG